MDLETLAFRFWISLAILGIFAIKVGGCMQLTEILLVFGPQFFFGGRAPEFLKSIYKIDTGSDHVAKFGGYRPRELGDYALKKKKHQEQNRRPPVYYRTGRSKNVTTVK